MIPLTRRDTAYFVRALCRKQQVPISALLRKIHDDGVPLTDTITLCYLSGVYYLRSAKRATVQGHYCVYVDTELYAQQLPRITAFALAEKLCQLLFQAREITVHYNGRCVLRWIRVPRSINHWRAKEEY